MENNSLRNLVISSLTVYLIYKLRNVLTPFFIALFIAYLINPVITFIETKFKIKNRGVSVTIGIASIILLLTTSTLISIPFINKEFQRAIDLIKEYSEFIPPISSELNVKATQFIESDYAKDFINSSTINETINKIIPLLKNLFSESIDLLMGVFGIFFILIYLIFILLGYPKLKESWPKWIPVKYRDTAKDIIDDLSNGMRAYFRGQVFIAFIVGLLFCIGFKIIGLPLAIFLGVTIGFLNLVPYMQILGFIPAFILCILHSMETGQSIWFTLGATAIVFMIIQLIQEILLIPKIMNKVTGLHPAIILLSLSIWGSLLGFTGLIIALPISTLLISYYKRHISSLSDEIPS
ncbi:MAG: AI-2E family transporter [Bacteroidetes bacterium MED-G21]|nr:MAG: AI-2E family transporter [Bacteroidetes bacterium MED-G21]